MASASVFLHDTGFYLGANVPLESLFKGLPPSVLLAWSWTSIEAAPDGFELIRATDVQTLWSNLSMMANYYEKATASPMHDQTVHIYMPCGKQLRYIAYDDIPWKDTQCPCGDPKHWVFRYVGAANPAG